MTNEKIISEVRTAKWMDADGVRHKLTKTFKADATQFERDDTGRVVPKSKDEIYWDLVREANDWQRKKENQHLPKREIKVGNLAWRE